jgi:ankyrin repeat protein/catechol 2,3-dioxygenase-like lactoylglutathione lyase family enzyme
MHHSKLPEHTSLEYLKKIAKERLHELRRSEPGAKLAKAQLAVAQDYGFTSWRALKAEIDRRGSNIAAFFEAAAKGNVEALRRMLTADPALARTANPDGDYGRWTALHTAAQKGHLAAVNVLLEHGADPNAREEGDNTYPLHWAAANRHLKVVRALLDAGGDPQGAGDVHGLDVIGWATFYHEPDGSPGDKPEVAALLIDRGARHHIFSALATGDHALIRQMVKSDPKALERRTSRFEGGQTALHFAAGLKRYDLLDLLLELGANLEAEDQNGHTVLAAAMMRGDAEAARRLQAAGAKPNRGWALATAKLKRPQKTGSRGKVADLAKSVTKIIPMLRVPDVAETLDWYVALGFQEMGRYPEQGKPDWGWLQLGSAQIMLTPGGKHDKHDVTLWFYLESVDRLYEILKSRQIAATQAALDNAEAASETIEFETDLWNPPYGGREFGIRDLNGYILYFRWGG